MSKHCEICDQDLLDDYAFQGHLLGKKHLKNAQQVNIQARSVYIYWGHNHFNCDDLVTYLSSFGKIEKYKFGPYLKYGIFQFEESKTVEELLKKEVKYKGTKLDVKPKTVSKNSTVTNALKNVSVEEPCSETSFIKLKPIFEQDNNFDEQLSLFLNTVALTDSEIEELYEPVCVHLNRLFRQSFPKCRSYRFGSTVTGLCFKKCDLDIYMNIGEPISTDENEKSPHILTFRKVFAEAKKLLFRKNHFYSKVIPIPRAKTPIIKFFNIPTKTSCDLSFRNSLGVHNSLLIKHYLSFDPRLKPLMMLIKYWTKHCDISTDTHGGRLTNYALVMLFIFYLQQSNVNLVPPVINLKRPITKPHIIDNWQVSFDKSFRHPSAENKSSIPELLHGFFNFYSNFNFKEYVICPIDGNMYLRNSFEDIDNLPESMSRYKEYMKNVENALPLIVNVQKPICIQDPTELNHNCAGNVSAFLLEVFQKHLSTSAEVCDKALKSECSRLLLNLFETMPEITKNSSKKTRIPIFLQNFLKVDESSDASLNDSNTGKFTKENLFDIVLELVKNIFTEVFKLKVEVSTLEPEQKQQKVEADSDVHTNDNEKIMLRCTGDRCLWRERKIKSVVLDPSYSILEKEVIISNKILEAKEQDNKTHLNFSCVFEKFKSPPKVIMFLSDKDSGKEYKNFAGFLKSRMCFIIEKTLAHMVQYKKNSISFDRFQESAN